MKLSEVDNRDGIHCAHLINLLKAGRWDLTGKDIQTYQDTLKWVQSLAVQMAQQLKGKPETEKPAATEMKVRNMGQMPVSKPVRKKKK